MGCEHNRLSHLVSAHLLQELQTGAATWAPLHLTTSCTLWHGMLDWPRPDGGFEDETTEAALAMEFKPPGHTKREYVTGLGQACAYLRYFDYSLLIVPERSFDGFTIADYRAKTLDQFGELPVGVIAYGPDVVGSLSVLRPVPTRPTASLGIPAAEKSRVFWAYWRDLSPHDAFHVMARIDREAASFDSAFEGYWREAFLTGRARGWERRERSPKSPASADAERTNTYLSLRQMGAIGSDGGLTEKGLRL